MLIQALSFPGPQYNTSRVPSGSDAGGVLSSPWRSTSLPFPLILSAPSIPAKISLLLPPQTLSLPVSPIMIFSPSSPEM
jgi:hypothetical protein